MNPLSDSTMDELKVSPIREKPVTVPGWMLAPLSRRWISTLHTDTGGYHTGRGMSPTEALDDALRALAEKRPL